MVRRSLSRWLGPLGVHQRNVNLAGLTVGEISVPDYAGRAIGPDEGKSGGVDQGDEQAACHI